MNISNGFSGFKFYLQKIVKIIFEFLTKLFQNLAEFLENLTHFNEKLNLISFFVKFFTYFLLKNLNLRLIFYEHF